jgi:hypothetical protein
MDTPQAPSLIRSLVALPVELVHQILNDLPLWAVLRLAAHDVPYIDDCILTHMRYRDFFESKHQLHTAKTYYGLYTFMSYPIRSYTPAPWRYLKNVFSTIPSTTTMSKDSLFTHKFLTDALHSSIRFVLEKEQPRVALLAPYSAVNLDVLPSLNTLSLLQERCVAIETAQQTLNSLRASQLRVIASLMAAYPSMLKQSSDPSQERRAFVKLHSLVLQAERISRLVPFDSQKKTKRTFHGNGWLPIVPYDRFLRLFLKVVELYPPGMEVVMQRARDKAKMASHVSFWVLLRWFHHPLSLSKLSAENQQAIKHPPNRKSLKPTIYPYPQTVAMKIIKTINGLNYVYTPDHFLHSDCQSQIIRTQYTPFSDPKWRQTGGLRQPKFVPDVGPWLKGKFLLYREEEIEWLEAFLQSCKFMSSMNEARWSATETVAQMWQRKSSV